MADVRVCADVTELAGRAAAAGARVINDAVRSNGRCSLVLSGGHTPAALYSKWASAFASEIAWHQVHVFWGDERFVPFDDDSSNYLMAKTALLDRVPCPAANIHPMPAMLPTPELAAREYEATLRRFFDGAPPRFDLLLLGLGSEGHTASLFPHSPALRDANRWVVPVTAPIPPPSRVTLTPTALNTAGHTYFLVTGSEKAAALKEVLSAGANADQFPAASIRPTGSAPVWWVDRPAAVLHASGT